MLILSKMSLDLFVSFFVNIVIVFITFISNTNYSSYYGCIFLSVAIILTTVGVRSELTHHHVHNIHWFVNFDKTEHKLSTEGPKGGVQA